MANIASLLKEEITRLSRRELQKHLRPMRKASAGYRREIAALKRQIMALQRQSKLLAKRAVNSGKQADPVDSQPPLRFVAKGLKSLRTRLDLSAAEFGKLAGVSAQTVYNWELKKTTPRKEQLASLASIRSLGKREARARLAETGGKGKRKA